MVDSRFDYQAALAGCALGDRSALQQLYAQEAPCLLALANLMLGNQALAQDAVHDAFVLIWKNADSYDSGMGDARAWIHSIMRHRASSLLRRHPPSASLATALPILPLRAHESTGSAGVLARQPEKLRQPILMAFYSGLGYSRIAARLGRPVAELRNNVRTCLQALREHDPA